MAFLELHFNSQALKSAVSVNVLLPEEPKTAPLPGRPKGTFKTLYLLHGLSGDRTAWMYNTSIKRYANDYQIAVVMPEVGRSWYTDTWCEHNYFTYITEELPYVCRSYFSGMTDRREDNMVAGLSMGGYGALKAALRCPEKYCACASLSGALDITRKGRNINIPEWQMIFDPNLKSGEELEDTENDLYFLTRKNKEAGLPFPKLFLWCGTEDELIKNNRRYRDLLQELDIPCRYTESEGTHTWKWWDLHIQNALQYLLNEE